MLYLELIFVALLNIAVTVFLYLLDGKTGDVLDCHQISEGVIEASPAVYQSYMVVGTRDCKIWGMELQ